METGLQPGKKKSRRPDGGHGVCRQEMMVALDQGRGSWGEEPLGRPFPQDVALCGPG